MPTEATSQRVPGKNRLGNENNTLVLPPSGLRTERQFNTAVVEASMLVSSGDGTRGLPQTQSKDQPLLKILPAAPFRSPTFQAQDPSVPGHARPLAQLPHFQLGHRDPSKLRKGPEVSHRLRQSLSVPGLDANN